MRTWSWGLRERTLQILAGLGLVLALGVMGAVFMSSAAQGDAKSDADAFSVSSEGKRADVDGTRTPSAVGIMLGVLVLGAGVTVLGLGARRPERAQDEPDLVPLDSPPCRCRPDERSRAAIAPSGVRDARPPHFAHSAGGR